LWSALLLDTFMSAPVAPVERRGGAGGDIRFEVVIVHVQVAAVGLYFRMHRPSCN
jgi:hypothetical protein